MQSSGIRPDGYTLSILLGVCSSRDLGCKEGRQIHGYIVRNIGNGDSFLDTAIIDMYLTWGQLKYGWRVFVMLSNKSSVVVWNVMIGGFCEKGLWECSLELYSLGKNEDVHCDVIKMGFQSDPYVYTSLLTMYGKCKIIEAAEEIFHLIQGKEIEVWNAMISAYTNNGYAYDALEVYKQMTLNAIPSDSFTILNILSSSGTIGLHDFGSYPDAKLVFSTMKERDVVAFSSMISGLCHNRLENVDLGRQIHGFVIKCGFQLDFFVASSLIDMYSKCGSAELAGNNCQLSFFLRLCSMASTQILYPSQVFSLQFHQ
ncbi:hypothetical protein Pint_06679 [Pistacia integerrima]|uniref:Uncharacterized protein n=1 Tax=Pistacia integerrima TaxID=434235 RepID=A0ACC0Z7B6_9ROSI|nr:hypothetical protein Pint_06679 [Pistacia integerrima]